MHTNKEWLVILKKMQDDLGCNDLVTLEETLEELIDTLEDYLDSDEEIGDGMTDVEADADVLRSAGYGTDEDYE